ncbi:ECF RNA polymerase sigma factor SigE [Kordia sp. SMS9]|uniref:RNA polymerase sigma factor n=1 Tax=Kordia sp. SMS9 TaxID=2282170 RepID=UPI000E0D6158|nr:RNA polymerase sigma factor [Kordia sp. SMS9]AXG69779.1 ECF RNA polymerase sigma factor SigE [Kordia sp. SMS9]
MKVIQLHLQEGQLIKRAKRNDRKAQQVLYAQHAPKMLSVCRYYIANLHDAEEVMLSGFFKVFTQLKTYKNKGSFEGWIRRIMIRESISFLRKRKLLVAVDEIENYTEITECEVNVNAGVEEIQKAIDALPKGYKIVFNLYEIEGYKHQEIAEMLNISVSTSKTQLFKAKKTLQTQLRSKKNRANEIA